MTFEESLVQAISKRGLNGLTFWRTADGKWQVSARNDGADGFRVATMTNPVEAAEVVLGGPFNGHAEIVSAQAQRIAVAIGRNLMARNGPLIQPAPVPDEDDEL